ncbi:MAG: lipopolysaccharide biosynthesis protein [Muribaculaceae bacterium]|nr:lipopolysaccharide biosynthesis protein [Muribaculaceae bacterium]
MAGIKSLAKDTAIYGMSSIIGRFLNWCLVPMYTTLFDSTEYGIVTYIYSITALLLIILTYGMETGFFRFANHEDYENPGMVYSTSMTSLGVTSTIFIVLTCMFCVPLSNIAECPGHPSYIWMMAIAVGVDAYTAIPFSYLRFKKKPVRFATLKLINIGLNIGLNLFFLILCPWINKVSPGSIDMFYNPDYGIGYIFLSNMISSLATLLMLYPEISSETWEFNGKLLKRMLRYSFPLLILGIAGVMNQSIDKIIYPWLVTDHAQAMADLGIYGANYKIAIVMVMFIQAFRFAYEPFIFAQNKEADGSRNPEAYSQAMTFFIIFALFIFMGVMFYIDILKYFISPAYFSGLKVVPIIMIAELFFGIFFNLSVWYKLTDKTIWGTWFSLGGLAVTLILNIVLVPRMGYMGCAWAAFFCYASMMVASYFTGRKRFPIPYQVGRIASYVVIAAVLYGLGYITTTPSPIINYGVRAVLLGIYIAIVLHREQIPLLHKTSQPKIQ